MPLLLIRYESTRLLVLFFAQILDSFRATLTTLFHYSVTVPIEFLFPVYFASLKLVFFFLKCGLQRNHCESFYNLATTCFCFLIANCFFYHLVIAENAPI